MTLAVTLADFERNGWRVALATNVVTRTGSGGWDGADGSHVAVQANSIVGFTLGDDLSFAGL